MWSLKLVYCISKNKLLPNLLYLSQWAIVIWLICFKLHHEIVQEGGYCFFKCSMEILIGEEVLYIDIHTSNEPEYEMVKYYQPPFHMLFLLWGLYWSCYSLYSKRILIIRDLWLNEPFNQLTSWLHSWYFTSVRPIWNVWVFFFHPRVDKAVLLKSSETDIN